MAPTQDALYRELDLDLSWSERDLPERERTKHVHRLHPYLGKFVPQLVEALLERHLPRARHVLDPFAGSGTTLVQSLESGRDATGVDVAAFNCLLMRVKTAEYNLFTLERELRDSLRRLERFDGARPPRPERLPRRVVRAAGRGGARLLPLARRRLRARRRPASRARAGGPLGAPDDALRPRLPARAAGRRVLVPQAQEDLPARSSAPSTSCAATPSTRSRGSVSSRACARAGARRSSSTATRASSSCRGPFDGVVTSPPYPGLIDYHEQHRYAYELLGPRRPARARAGRGRARREREGDPRLRRRASPRRSRTCAQSLRPRAPVVIVINDRRELYPEILERAGLGIETRYRRHVNRRTGRRAGEFFEDVIVAAARAAGRRGRCRRCGRCPTLLLAARDAVVVDVRRDELARRLGREPCA